MFLTFYLLLVAALAFAALVFWRHFMQPQLTIKETLQGVLHCLLDLFHPVIDYVQRCLDWLRPRLTFRPLVAMVSADVGFLIHLASGQQVHPAVVGAVVVANLVAPFTPANAPAGLAAPRPNPRLQVAAKA